MSRKTLVLAIVLAIAVLTIGTIKVVRAQEQPEQPPQAQQRGLVPKCVDVMLMPTSFIERIDLFTDADGDRWVTLREKGNGKVVVGYVSMKFQKFCVVGEGKINRET